jgi:hypothetical protein
MLRERPSGNFSWLLPTESRKPWCLSFPDYCALLYCTVDPRVLLAAATQRSGHRDVVGGAALAWCPRLALAATATCPLFAATVIICNCHSLATATMECRHCCCPFPLVHLLRTCPPKLVHAPFPLKLKEGKSYPRSSPSSSYIIQQKATQS